MWLEIDGALAHFASPVHTCLSAEFPDKEIERNRPPKNADNITRIY